jgi:hypothetical protein
MDCWCQQQRVQHDHYEWVLGVVPQTTTTTRVETSLKLLVDDGDGLHVLPITIKLSPVTVSQSTTAAASKAQTDPGPSKRDIFPSKEERLARKRAKAVEELAHKEARSEASTSAKDGLGTKTKTYVRKDIRVGDTVRVIGRIDEYARKKASGELEWVRTLWVEEGSGGSIGESEDCVMPDSPLSPSPSRASILPLLPVRVFSLSFPYAFPSTQLTHRLQRSSIRRRNITTSPKCCSCTRPSTPAHLRCRRASRVHKGPRRANSCPPWETRWSRTARCRAS